jgi:hypothetical protein
MRRPILAVLCCLPALAWSAEPLTSPGAELSLDFSVRIGKARYDFDYADGTAAESRLEWLGVSWYEQVAPRVQLGLSGGKLLLTQTGNAATAGMEPDGYYAGIDLRVVLLQTSALQLFAHASYAYQRVKHKSAGDSVTLTWYDPRLQIGAAVSATPRLRLFGGGRWNALDGQQRITGAAAQTLDFEADRAVGGFAGPELALEREGFVGIEARSGAGNGGEIYFKKLF